jgi:DNA (cytosine-5)-methyltransferase 1
VKTHLDLFSGIGGFALAAKWAGYETVQFVEIEQFPCKVLKKHWPNVPIHNDIKTFDGTKYNGTIELLTGGFPCQPYSVAGKRLGKEDDRALWPEMLRIISEVRPNWVIAENVAGILSMGIKHYVTDLENEGYSVQSFIIPACATGAPHRRDRIWIVACNTKKPISKRDGRGSDGDSGRMQWSLQIEGSGCLTSDNGISQSMELPWCIEECRDGIGNSNSDDSNTIVKGLQRCEPREPLRLFGQCDRSGSYEKPNWTEKWFEAATRLCRIHDGIPRGLDRTKRLKALGNAIVPQVAYEIIKAIP